MADLITEANAIPTDRPHHYVVEASDIGLQPGQWPPQLATTLGNKLPFVAERSLGSGGLLYIQSYGCVYLTVLND